MEAKDSMMNILKREKVYGDWASNPFNDKTEEWIKNIILDVAQIQAEISFPLGMQEEASGGKNSISYLEGYEDANFEWRTKKVPKIMEQFKKIGIKEVVEWLSEHIHEGRGDDL